MDGKFNQNPPPPNSRDKFAETLRKDRERLKERLKADQEQMRTILEADRRQFNEMREAARRAREKQTETSARNKSAAQGSGEPEGNIDLESEAASPENSDFTRTLLFNARQRVNQTLRGNFIFSAETRFQYTIDMFRQDTAVLMDILAKVGALEGKISNLLFAETKNRIKLISNQLGKTRLFEWHNKSLELLAGVFDDARKKISALQNKMREAAAANAAAGKGQPTAQPGGQQREEDSYKSPGKARERGRHTENKLVQEQAAKELGLTLAEAELIVGKIKHASKGQLLDLVRRVFSSEDPAAVKKNYRKMVREFHPDRSGDDKVKQEKFKIINGLYAEFESRAG